MLWLLHHVPGGGTGAHVHPPPGEEERPSGSPREEPQCASEPKWSHQQRWQECHELHRRPRWIKKGNLRVQLINIPFLYLVSHQYGGSFRSSKGSTRLCMKIALASDQGILPCFYCSFFKITIQLMSSILLLIEGDNHKTIFFPKLLKISLWKGPTFFHDI